MVSVFVPARIDSTRFPRKMLAKINGVSLIRRVVKNVEPVAKAHRFDFAVLTDSVEIFNEVSDLCRVHLTPTTCKNGTERCAKFVDTGQYRDTDVVVNVQGDMPFLDQADLSEFFTLCRVSTQDSTVFTAKSKQDIVSMSPDGGFHRQSVECHIGLYAYRVAALRHYLATPETAEEKSKRLEQVRFASLGYRFRTITFKSHPMELNTERDYETICMLKRHFNESW